VFFCFFVFLYNPTLMSINHKKETSKKVGGSLSRARVKPHAHGSKKNKPVYQNRKTENKTPLRLLIINRLHTQKPQDYDWSNYRRTRLSSRKHDRRINE
jgi:hypothetical protein